MDWVSVERLGYFGKKRDEKHRQFDETYGEGNWRIMWRWGKEGRLIIPFYAHDRRIISACTIYEDAYFIDSFKREGTWLELIAKANNVCDIDEGDVESGLDYLVQKGPATHVQDIAVRNVVCRRGWNFEGSELINIRSHKLRWGQKMSPGKILFHTPDLIISPHSLGWWDYNTVEDFYQSNKILQIRK